MSPAIPVSLGDPNVFVLFDLDLSSYLFFNLSNALPPLLTQT